MGWAKTEKQTYHVIQKDWRSSPEVWKSMAGFFVAGVVAGLILYAYLSGSTSSSSPSPRTTVTVTVTSAP